MRTTSKLLLLVGSALAAVVPAMPAHAAVTDAEISNFSFSPDPLTIHVGDTLRWTNKDGTSHTVTADDGSFTSQSLGSQATFTHTFNAPGPVAYHCAIHPSMQGTITVAAVTTTAAPTTTTTAAPTTTTTAAPTTTTKAGPTTTTNVAGGSATPTTAGKASPKATSPTPAASPTTRATVATTTTVPPAAPVASATTATAPLLEAAPPVTEPALDTASDNYGSSSGAGIGLAVAAVVILGAAAGGWWFIRRRRSAA
jgi:plastocyanin